MPSETTTRDVVTASSRQRPEDILAHTLSTTSRSEGSDGWSARGRRIFLVAMAVSGVLLVVAGLLVTKELAPSTGHPAPFDNGPGNGSGAQLLQSHDDQPSQTTPASAPLAIPIPAPPAGRTITPTDTPSSGAPTPTALQSQTPSRVAADNPTPTTLIPKAPTTTVPCGVIVQTLQQAQLPIPCGTGSALPLGGLG